MLQPPRPPGRPAIIRLVAVNGRILASGGMTAAHKPRNGDEDEPRPLSKAEGEAKLVRFLRSLEGELADKGDDFWEEVAILRAQAEHRAARRRR